jgi:hypothetical protein
VFSTENTSLTAGGSLVLLESDVHEVVGCPFVVGLVYMPCVTVQWEAGATSLSVDGVGVLTETSVGTCFNAAEAPQGVAIVSAGEPSLEAI